MKIETQTQKFSFTGLGLPIKPQVAGKCLLEIYKKNHELTPELVVNEAKNKTSPLHPCFEWNDKIAAQKHRLSQAQKIINCLVVEKKIDGEMKKVRAFVNIQRDEQGKLSHNPFSKGNSNYIYLEEAMQDDFLKKYTVEQALIELNRWMEKYEKLKQLSAIYSAIKKAMKKKKK